MKRLIVVAMLLSGACTHTPAPAESSYIASDETAAMLLEMKPGEGHEVKGTLSAVGTGDGGKLTSGSRTFSGTVDGKAVNLSIENGTGVTLATGVMTGDGLELTFLNNGVSAKMLFKPEPAEQFPKLVDQFRERSAEQKQAAQQDALLAVQQKALSADQDGINGVAADLNAKAQVVADAADRSAGLDPHRLRNRCGWIDLLCPRAGTGCSREAPLRICAEQATLLALYSKSVTRFAPRRLQEEVDGNGLSALEDALCTT